MIPGVNAASVIDFIICIAFAGEFSCNCVSRSLAQACTHIRNTRTHAPPLPLISFRISVQIAAKSLTCCSHLSFNRMHAHPYMPPPSLSFISVEIGAKLFAFGPVRMWRQKDTRANVLILLLQFIGVIASMFATWG
jgi:hypothetical protein